MSASYSPATLVGLVLCGRRLRELRLRIDGDVSADAGFDPRSPATAPTPSAGCRRNVLLVGTLGDEWAIAEQTTTEPFGPANAQTRRQSTYGSSNVSPVRVGGDTLFVQKSGRKVRAMAFRFEEDGFDSPDVTVFAEAHHEARHGGHGVSTGAVLCALGRSLRWRAGRTTFNRRTGRRRLAPPPVLGWRGRVRRESIPRRTSLVTICGSSAGTQSTASQSATWRTSKQRPTETTEQADWFYVEQGATYSAPPPPRSAAWAIWKARRSGFWLMAPCIRTAP